MTIFGIDAASFQGNVNWLQVDLSTDFGAEKVTEGTGYLNPFWKTAKPALIVRAKATGFVPLAYMFLDANPSGIAQADWFHQNAGDLTGFGIVVDLERAPDGNPTVAAAHDCVDRLRQLYPHHPIGGYAPHWYTGSADLTFFDWTWASQYLLASGTPQQLYPQVPASWWAPYGGMTPLLLQFTNKAAVPGVSGPVDCSAFKGTAADLAGHVLPRAAPPPPPPPPPPPTSNRSDDVFTILRPGDPETFLSVWAGAASVHAPKAFSYATLHLTGGTGAVVVAALTDGTGKTVTKVLTLTTGKRVPVDLGSASVVSLRRTDKNAAVGASARLVNW